MSSPAIAGVTRILTGATATGAGTVYDAGVPQKQARVWQAVLTGSGAVSATVLIEVSLTGADDEFLTLVEIALDGDDKAVDGGATEAPWAFYRARVSAIAGSGASVSVWMGR